MQTSAATDLSGPRMIVLGNDPVGKALRKQYGRTALPKEFLDELFGTRLPDSGHLTTEKAIRVQPPTVGLRAKEDPGYVEVQASAQPVPDSEAKKAATALAAAAKTSSFGNNEGDGAEDKEPDLSEESLQAKNPEVAEALYLAKKRGRGNDAARRRYAASLYQQAVIVSLPNKHRGPNHYAPLKQRSNALSKEQVAERVYRRAQRRALVVELKQAIPTPFFMFLREATASLIPTNTALGGPAAAKQASRQTTRSTGFIAWMKEAYTKNAFAPELSPKGFPAPTRVEARADAERNEKMQYTWAKKPPAP